MQTIGLCLFWQFVNLISSIDMTKIDLSNQQLSTVPTNLSSDVISLNLDKNSLISLNADSFFNYPELEDLDLSYNELEVIGEGSFNQQTMLKRLTLRHNRIRQLPTYFGPSTSRLKAWDIYAGFTTTAIFQRPYFIDFISLIHLELGSPGEELFIDTSILPSSMLFFDMHSGIMTTLPDFSYTPNLNIFYAKNLELEHIPQRHIDALIKVKLVILRGNKLALIPNFSHMPLMRELYLNDNRLQDIHRSHISGLVSLEKLTLNRNYLHAMPNVSFLSKLTELILSENDIKEVPASTLYGIPNLLTLKLTKNKISVIGDISALWAHVYLENNNMTTLPDLYDMRLETLMMEGNPLSCNQSLCWLRMWPWNKTLPTLDDAYCTTPSDMSELKAVRVHPTQLQCFNGMAIIIESYKHYQDLLYILCDCVAWNYATHPLWH